MKRTARLVSLSALAAAMLCCAWPPSAGAGRAADREALLQLHRDVLRAHLTSDVDLLLRAEGDDYIVANRGEVTRPTLEERRARFGPYFGSTRFSTYRDLVPPVVEVSDDGTLGWVIVQIEAVGEQTAADGTIQPIEFVSAWIELYKKEAGVWRRTGNVSNFKPEG